MASEATRMAVRGNMHMDTKVIFQGPCRRRSIGPLPSCFVVFLLEFFCETVKESFPAIHLSCKNCNKIAVPRGTAILLRFSCENFDKIASQYVPKSLLSCNVPELPWFSFRFVCFAS